MDRFWLLTWTTYGTWLPGDARGFVTDLRDQENRKYRRNEPGTECVSDLPGLRAFAQAQMESEPVFLEKPQAEALLVQFHETARFRGWTLLAAAIMANHVHLVVAVPNDPDPEQLLQAFKAYGSRVLNRQFGRPASETWWTASGSTRKLPNESAVLGAVEYVWKQQNPLVVWVWEQASGGR